MQNQKELFIFNTLKSSLNSLSRILDKAIQHVNDNKATEESILNAKLHENMFNFTKQVEIASDLIKNSVMRLTDREAPTLIDGNTTLSGLVNRLETVRNYLNDIQETDIKNIDNAIIKLYWMPEGMSWTGKAYVEQFVIPNTLFHVVTAYDILRNQGVDIGKMTYLGEIK